MEETDVIEKIEKSPNALSIFRHLQRTFKDENKRRREFYETVREDQKAEFINGEIVIHSPVMRRHSQASFALANAIFNFLKDKDIGEIHHEKLMVRLTRNDYEPDVCFFGKEKADTFKPEQLLFPAPDFVAEVISKSTEQTDRTIKFEDYQNHGVAEYWLIDPETRFVEQYLLSGEKYELYKKTDTGTVKSKAIKGFEIEVERLF